MDIFQIRVALYESTGDNKLYVANRIMMRIMQQFHYTNLKGHNAISSQLTWLFKANQPPLPRVHQFGAYFTDFSVETPHLAKKLWVPKSKIEYFFAFEDVGDLQSIEGGRGEHIFYSSDDYPVVENRQGPHGERIHAVMEKEQ
jgi:hypothetical protein